MQYRHYKLTICCPFITYGINEIIPSQAFLKKRFKLINRWNTFILALVHFSS